MGKQGNGGWWSSIGLGRTEPVPDTDYADMGTAFGLDASLSPPEGDDVPPAEGARDADRPYGRRPR